MPERREGEASPIVPTAGNRPRMQSEGAHPRFMCQDVYHCVIYNIEKLEMT